MLDQGPGPSRPEYIDGKCWPDPTRPAGYIGEEKTNLQDWAQIGMLGVQDNLSWRTRFLAVCEAIL